MWIGVAKYRRTILFAIGVGLALAAGVDAAVILTGRNFHSLIPKRVFRCAQPSAADLQEYIRRHGIRTVVNLRGCCYPQDWYLDECNATCRCDIAQEDITFSAGRLPAPAELKRLVEVLDRAEYPILIHCKRGVDRTGLTSAVVKLLFTDASIREARKELSLRYGHLSWGRTAAMLQFFDLYEEWLKSQGRSHSAIEFRHWATRDYCPGPFRAEMTLLSKPHLSAG